METQTKTRQFSYSSGLDQMGLAPWKDCQTNRWISRRTLAKRTSLPLKHITDFENGRDGYGCKMTNQERQAAEAALGVELS